MVTVRTKADAEANAGGSSSEDLLNLGVVLKEGRTFNSWHEQKVPEDVLRRLYDLVSFGPTSTNCQPLRVKFVVSRPEKEKLLGALWPGNRVKTEGAPVTAVLGMDLDFPAKMDKLFAHAPAVRESYIASPAYARETAFRNSSIQGGYFILAARSLGLDCGPLSGFDKAKMDEAFWKGSAVETNFVCNLGYGKREDLFARKPRLNFDEACWFV